ncbi:MAG: M28 family peptidase [Candidatus Aminicenantes bacterium]|nr:M28 family peptidase [Candidatus Aminicenantes bacterium]
MKKLTLLTCMQLFIMLLLSPLTAQSNDNIPVDKKTASLLINEISGERAMDYIHKISRFHRIRGGGEGSGFNRAVDYVVETLDSLGLKNVNVERFPSDGFATYIGWRSPVGWRVKSAKLWMVKPRLELIADFSHQAVSLMPYSSGGSDEAEVIYVGAGHSDKDYEGIEVKGKIVFADSGSGATVHRNAVLKRGALGVVVGPSNRESRLEFADLIEMSRLSPTGEERAKTKWGFSLSRRQTKKLLRFFKGKKSKVVMKAEVDAELFDGEMPVISAAIEGSLFPDQEIILMGHLDHYKPGANDNASGSAGLMEIAGSLTTLIKEGKLKAPARTIRFLWLPELHGAAAYVSKHTGIDKRGLLGINLDMIGEHYEKCRAYFYITEAPYSAPGFIDVVIADAAAYVDDLGIRSPRGSFIPFNYKKVGYWGGSDHAVFCDPSIGVPSIMLGHGDVFHHSSYDTPDKCDPTELRRVIATTALATWATAGADDHSALKIAAAVHRKWLDRLHQRTADSIKWLLEKSEKKKFAGQAAYMYRKVLAYSQVLAGIEKKALADVEKLCRTEESRRFFVSLTESTVRHVLVENRSLKDFYRFLCKQKKIAAKGPKLAALEKKAQKIIPKRLRRGPLPYNFLYEQLGDDYDWYSKNWKKVGTSSRNKMFEVLNLCNGSHDALFIRDVISMEFGEADIEFVIHFLQDLKKLKVVEANI